MSSPIRFEEPGTDPVVEGYWGVPNSSIDWCERNYAVTPYLAEFWNCVSNLVLVVVGLVGILRARQTKLEGRFYVMAALIYVVGLGSAAFHGTLRYSAQLLDELPMVYAMLSWTYTLWLMDYSKTKSTPYGLVFFLLAYGIGWSVLHAFFAFTVAFQVQFGGIVVFGLVLLHRCCKKYTGLSFLPFVLSSSPYPHERWSKAEGAADSPKAASSMRSLQVLCIGYFWFLILAFVLWLTDQFACSQLHNLPFGIPNPQLHAWWHILVGFNCHFGITFCQCLRQAIVERRLPRTRWHFGLIPLVVDRPGR